MLDNQKVGRAKSRIQGVNYVWYKMPLDGFGLRPELTRMAYEPRKAAQLLAYLIAKSGQRAIFACKLQPTYSSRLILMIPEA